MLNLADIISIALFNQAYQNVYDNAGDEYLALFARKTLQFVRAPDENVFVPPFNLIEIFLLVPFELILSKARYHALNNFVLQILYAPYLTCVALYESKLHKKRVKAEDGDFDDDELDDEHEDQDIRGWHEICEKELPSMKTEMDVLQEIQERLDKLEKSA